MAGHNRFKSTCGDYFACLQPAFAARLLVGVLEELLKDFNVPHWQSHKGLLSPTVELLGPATEPQAPNKAIQLHVKDPHVDSAHSTLSFLWPY
eukprot:2882909-Amphidinium_carterae.1